MFRELLTLLKGSDPLKDMYEELITMVASSRKMFDLVWPEAVAGKLHEHIKAAVQQVDIEVNRTERRVRRRLAEHMSVQPGADAPACLVLMSIVKDAERLGDYCKDMLKAAGMERKALSDCQEFASFQSAHDGIHIMLGKLLNALDKSDRSLAREVMLQEREISEQCNVLMEKLAAGNSPCSAGIPWALIARYLHRIAAHTSNIASGLVMPLHKLDYHDEEWLREQPK